MAIFPTIAKAASICARLAVLAISFGLTAGIALAQTAAPAPAPAAAPAESVESAPNPWWKICNVDERSKREVCIIKQDVLTDAGQFLASIQVHTSTGEARKRLIAAVAPGMQIQPGLQVKIDEKEGQLLKYGICLEDACIAELAVDDDFVEHMKSGKDLVLTAINQQGKQRPYLFPLEGFVSAYDGAGMDQQAAAQHQQALRAQVEKRANDLRQKLIDAQRKATGN